MKKLFGILLSSIMILSMFGGVVQAKTSYDITDLASSGGKQLIIFKARTFAAATVGETSWAGTAPEGCSSSIAADGVGDTASLKMTSSAGNSFSMKYLMNEYNMTAANSNALKFAQNSLSKSGTVRSLYRFKVNVKTEGLAEGILPYIGIDFSSGYYQTENYGSSGNVSYARRSRGINTNGEWQELDVVFSVPEELLVVSGSTKYRAFSLVLNLPGNGTVYWDNPQLLTNEFLYYGDNSGTNYSSTITDLSSGKVNISYHPDGEAFEVGQSATMIAGIYYTNENNQKKLVSVSAPVTKIKTDNGTTSDTTLKVTPGFNLKASIDVPTEYAAAGYSLQTFIFKSIGELVPVTEKEVLSYRN